MFRSGKITQCFVLVKLRIVEFRNGLAMYCIVSAKYDRVLFREGMVQLSPAL